MEKGNQQALLISRTAPLTHVADDLLRSVDAVRVVSVRSLLSRSRGAVGVDSARRRERVSVERQWESKTGTSLHLIRGSPGSVSAGEVERTILNNGVVLRLLIVVLLVLVLLLLPLAIIPREGRSDEREEGNSEGEGLHVDVDEEGDV